MFRDFISPYRYCILEISGYSRKFCDLFRYQNPLQDFTFVGFFEADNFVFTIMNLSSTARTSSSVKKIKLFTPQT